ncbi:MAG: SMP-30/gluconolactonase/LRE family protein [Gemmobacter sp.]|nr:SMP-30/gluconolactonase/LRE family protein [Gemmobacter sp.]
MTLTPVSPFSVADLTPIGQGLNRPECVLALRDGTLFTGDWTLGIARIAPDGTVTRAVEADLIGQGFLPNGIALTDDGRFLFANLGEAGGVWSVAPRGPVAPVATEVDGKPIPPANFVLVDGARLWVTISASSRKHTYFTDQETTGQIMLIENGVPMVVASGLTWTNELRLSPDGLHLFVNETFACRTTRFDISADGSLGHPVHIVYPAGVFPDGLAVDEEGGLWAICVVSNQILRIGPDLTWHVIFSDIDPTALAAIGTAHAERRLTRDMIIESRGQRVSNLSSLAFGGPDLRTLYLGGLTVSSVFSCRVSVAGAPMAHHR